MAMSTYRDVLAFHHAFDQPIRSVPTQLPREELRLRIRLITEEFLELIEALVGHEATRELMTIRLTVAHMVLHAQPYDPAHVAKEAVDLKYVVDGTGVQAGLDLDAAHAAVHASNMAKVGPLGEVVRDAGGKVLKPHGWRPPDVAAALGLDADYPEAA